MLPRLGAYAPRLGAYATGLGVNANFGSPRGSFDPKNSCAGIIWPIFRIRNYFFLCVWEPPIFAGPRLSSK